MDKIGIKGTDAKYAIIQATGSDFTEVRIYHTDPPITYGGGATERAALTRCIEQCRTRKQEMRRIIRTLRWLKFKALLRNLFHPRRRA